MANSLIPGMLGYEFDKLAQKKARLAKQENKLMEKFNQKVNAQTLQEVFDIIEAEGKPYEQKTASRIKERYDSGEQLNPEDVMLLDKLYKACGTCLMNKEVENE